MQVMMSDGQLRPRGVLPVLAGKLVMKNNDIGSFQLTVNGNSPKAARFVPGWRVSILDDDGSVLGSGPATQIGQRLEDANRTRTDTLMGVTDHDVLATSVVIPNPTTPTDQTEAWKGTGAAETVIRNLISAQVGPTAPATYKNPYLRLDDDRKRGSNVAVASRFKNLLEEVQDQLTAGNLIMDVYQSGTAIWVTFRQARDLTRSVRLTRKNSAVGSADLTMIAPTVTEAIVGGTGTGSARTLFRQSYGLGDWGRRVTQFIDRGSAGGSAEMQQAAKTALDEGVQKASVTFEANDIPRLRFGRNFKLGDKITVELGERATVMDTVQIAEINWDEKGRTVKLQVGPTADETKLNQATGPLMGVVKNLSKQLRETQTR